MSNQEYCQKLYQDYFETSQEFLSISRELPRASEAEKGSKASMYASIRSRWQTAVSRYWDFLALLKEKGINPNDEVQFS